MSAPAMNALSPAPVNTTTRMPSSSRNSSSAAAPSARVWMFKAFRFSGRLIVTMATRSRRSTSKVSYDCDIKIFLRKIVSGCRFQVSRLRRFDGLKL
jgi:hypothetical protein